MHFIKIFFEKNLPPMKTRSTNFITRNIIYPLVKRYRHSTIPRWSILLMDILLIGVAFFITKLFHCADFTHISISFNKIIAMCVVIGITVISFMIFGTYKSIIRHSGIKDIVNIIFACALPMVILAAVNFINNNTHFLSHRMLISYKEIVMLYTILLAEMVAVRLFMQRIYNDYFKKQRPVQTVLIYGAGAAGIITYNALMQDLHYDYSVAAFIDDDESKISQKLNRVPVMRARMALSEQFVKANDVKQIIIAIPTIKSRHKQAITNRALKLGLEVKAVPHITTWIDGGFTSNQIENIKIEDLLERESIKLDNTNIAREVSGKVVMVTGAAGSIGSEICRQLIQYNPSKVIMLDQAESPMYDLQFELKNNEPYRKSVDKMEFVIANVKDKIRMEEVFATFKPQVIYHAAAYKHVPFMEENPYEAIFVNVFGTRNVADLAIKYKAEKFVMISTDKAVNPTNVMGATKRMAEIYIQSRSTDITHFVTTRFGNVLGSNGSVIPLFKKQLAAGGPLTVTHKDIIRYFMTIPEACNLVLEAGAMGEGGDIFVFDMGKPVKIYNLAEKMIQLSGMKNIEIKEIGLRPGEKLYEELLATKENNIPTYHPKIMRAQVRKYSLSDIDQAWNELWDILITLDDMKIVEKMKEVVPEFVSNNSIYCQLDKKN